LTGDKVLRTIGELLNRRDVFRENDIKGRFGGEEFALTISAGVAQFRPEELSCEEMIKRADIALLLRQGARPRPGASL